MKLSNLFETWGWAVRGETPPKELDKKPKKRLTRKEHKARLKKLERLQKRQQWTKDIDVSDELLEKQRKANLARRTRGHAQGKFFPED